MYINASIAQNLSGQIMLKILNPQFLCIKQYKVDKKIQTLKKKHRPNLVNNGFIHSTNYNLVITQVLQAY